MHSKRKGAGKAEPQTTIIMCPLYHKSGEELVEVEQESFEDCYPERGTISSAACLGYRKTGSTEEAFKSQFIATVSLMEG